jgi:predicted dehydrogenase
VSEPLRVGVVGYGMSGRGIHAPLLTHAGLDVAMIATGNDDRVASARSDHPRARVVDDLDAALAVAREDGIELIVLASATHVHADQVRACVPAGMPVVVDKPLATTADDAAAALREAEQSGVAVSVFQNRRWDADQLTLAALLDQGRLGRVFRIERRYERFRPQPKRRPGVDPWRERNSAAQGGGVLLDLHAHLIDQVAQLFGPIRTVFAQLAAHTTVAEDDALLVCQHDDGVTSQLSAHSIAGAPGPTLRVLGSEAAYLVPRGLDSAGTLAGPEPPEGHTGWLAQDPDTEPVPTAPGGPVDYYRQVSDWVRGTGPAPVDPWDAVHTLAVIDAARSSAQSGQVAQVHNLQ